MDNSFNAQTEDFDDLEPDEDEEDDCNHCDPAVQVEISVPLSPSSNSIVPKMDSAPP